MNRLDILLFIAVGCGLSCLGTMGYCITNTDNMYKGTWAVGGNSAYVFLFITSCIASTIGLLVLGNRDETNKSRFFTSFNGLMAIFYVSGAIASIVISTELRDGSKIKDTAIAGSVIGMVASLVHGLTSFLSRG